MTVETIIDGELRESGKRLECYDAKTDEWHEVKSEGAPRGVLGVENEFCVGKSLARSGSVCVISPLSNRDELLVPMSERMYITQAQALNLAACLVYMSGARIFDLAATVAALGNQHTT